MHDLRKVIDTIEQGILVCDRNGRIEYFNASYGAFIGRRLEDVRGKRLLDVRPGAAAPRVLATGEAIRSLYRKENDEVYFADIYPIKEGNKTVGTVSVVTYVDRAQYIRRRVEELEREEEKLKARMNLTNGTRYTFDSIVGDSLAIQNTIALAKRIAEFDSNILLQGESGSGKELFAQAIHNASARRAQPFVVINCAAISKTMLESELFGYEEGSFTGARKGGKTGLFEAAEGGTVFLDEISEMDYELQAKLLRVLQEKKLRRIGGIDEIEVNVRVICACNVDLRQYISDKKFRSDLYYRISVAPISVPPLRERREDIPDLARAFIQSAGIQNKRTYHMTEEAKALVMNYTWPGNIRELKNAIEYAAMMSADGVIDADTLPPSLIRAVDAESGLTGRILKDRGAADHLPLTERVRAFERREIERTLEKLGSGTEAKREAAKQLGISLSSLYAKLGTRNGGAEQTGTKQT